MATIGYHYNAGLTVQILCLICVEYSILYFPDVGGSVVCMHEYVLEYSRVLYFVE